MRDGGNVSSPERCRLPRSHRTEGSQSRARPDGLISRPRALTLVCLDFTSRFMKLRDLPPSPRLRRTAVALAEAGRGYVFRFRVSVLASYRFRHRCSRSTVRWSWRRVSGSCSALSAASIFARCGTASSG